MEEIPAKTKEAFDRRYALQATGVDINYVAGRVAKLLDMDIKEVWMPGKYKPQVMARSLLCYWSVRALGESMTAMAKRLDISTVAVGESVKRGRQGLGIVGKLTTSPIVSNSLYLYMIEW